MLSGAGNKIIFNIFLDICPKSYYSYKCTISDIVFCQQYICSCAKDTDFEKDIKYEKLVNSAEFADYGKAWAIMKGYAEEALKRFNYLAGEIDAVYHEAAVKMGLSDSAFNILYTICELGDGCSQSDVCRLSGISRQTINSAIRKLEKDQVIRLQSGQGRNKRVFLTKKGEDTVKEKVLPLIAIENEIFREWEERDREELLRLTLKYKDDFKRKLLTMNNNRSGNEMSRT